jgi:hypothetical protein
MSDLDTDTLVKIATAFAAVVAAVITVLFGYYGQIKIKQFELRAQARKDRAAQRFRFFIPLLRFSYELDGRIGRILDSLHTDWLRLEHLEKIRRTEGFSKNPLETGYFIMSSVYVFACFFGWTEAIKKGVNATEPYSDYGRARKWHLNVAARVRQLLRSRPASKIFFFDVDISVVRRLFQYQELFKNYVTSKKLVNPTDACRLHRHLQHSIGEMMLQPDGDMFRCKTFREFADAYRENESVRYWFVPLEEFFADLSDFPPGKDIETQAEMKNDIRPLRLLAIRYWCRVLMRNLSADLGIQTPPPDDVLAGLSDALKSTIQGVTIENLELYLAGIPLKNR